MKYGIAALLVCSVLVVSPSDSLAEPIAVFLEPNEYIEVPSSPSLRGFDALTIECWFNPGNWYASGNEHIVGIGYIEQDYYSLYAYPPEGELTAVPMNKRMPLTNQTRLNQRSMRPRSSDVT